MTAQAVAEADSDGVVEADSLGLVVASARQFSRRVVAWARRWTWAFYAFATWAFLAWPGASAFFTWPYAEPLASATSCFSAWTFVLAAANFAVSVSSLA